MTNRRKLVIVIGAGAAGLVTACRLVEAGLEVTVLEAQPRKRWGSGHCVEIDSGAILNGVLPSPDDAAVVHRGARGADVLSPSRRFGFAVSPLPVHLVRLKTYQEQLLKSVEHRGGEVQFGARVESLWREDERTWVRVVGRGRREDLTADLVVLAGGDAFHLDRELYAHFHLRRKVLARDLIVATQELRAVEAHAVERERLWAPPGTTAYAVGVEGPISTLAVWLDEDLRQASILAGAITADGHPHPDEMLVALRREHVYLGRRLSGGGGAIPIRRAVEMLAAPGLALVGNAACQTYPTTASGLALIGHASQLLAAAAARYCRGGLRLADLWAYNVEYQRRFGRVQAGAEVFANGLRRLPDAVELQERLFELGVADAQDFLRGLELGAAFPPLWSAVRKVPALLKLGRWLPPLSRVQARAAAVSAMYRFYPQAADAHQVRGFASRVESVIANA